MRWTGLMESTQYILNPSLQQYQYSSHKNYRSLRNIRAINVIIKFYEVTNLWKNIKLFIKSNFLENNTW